MPESYRVGDSDQTFVGYPLIAMQYKYTATEVPFTIPVPMGFALIGVGHMVDTAFNAATNVAVGISGDTDYWLTETNVAGTVVGKIVQSFGTATVGSTTHTLYESAAFSVLVSTGSTTNTTVGNGRVFLFGFDVAGNWRDETPGY
jgi:hypothetical protein